MIGRAFTMLIILAAFIAAAFRAEEIVMVFIVGVAVGSTLRMIAEILDMERGDA